MWWYVLTRGTVLLVAGVKCLKVVELYGGLFSVLPLNPLALELDIYSLVKHLCKM